MSGPYGEVGARLVERGYAAIPIIPGTKRPGELKRGEWVGKTNWRDEYTKRLPSRFELQIWSASPAGACVVCGAASRHLVGIDIDTDDIAIKGAIIGALPLSTVIKRGAKGETRFFRAPAIDKSKSWNLINAEGNKYRVCDLIGPGRQTVLPPTIHPDTGKPYVWLTGDALEDTNPEDLSELLPEHIEAIDAALAEFGYQPEPEHRCQSPSISADDDSIWRRLNAEALGNLNAWVPALGLYRCRRTAVGYEAVATWRASNTGQRPERRKLNLKISSRGIMDFGDGPCGYTALDLTMQAFDCTFDAAFAWLWDQLGWNDSALVINLKPRAAKVPGGAE